MLKNFVCLLCFSLLCLTTLASSGTIEEVRKVLVAKKNGQAFQQLNFLELAGYSSHWEVDLGNGLRAILVSRNLGGDILIFDVSGTLMAQLETNEIVSLELFDFDNDGGVELVTEQVDIRGTGILAKSFYIHKVTSKGAEQIWKGIGYSHATLPGMTVSGSAAFEVIRGYIRCEPGGGGRPGPSLLHLIETSKGGTGIVTTRRAYLMDAGAFKEIPWNVASPLEAEVSP